MRIAVIGYSGAGKSTLARRLGALLDVPVLQILDAYSGKTMVLRSPRAVEALLSDAGEGMR